MEQISYYSTLISFIIIVLTWLVFAGNFLLRKKDASAPDAKRAPKSFFGIALQGIAFAVVWAIHRSPVFSPFVDNQYGLNVILQILAVLSAAGSVWLASSAIKELGKQWSLQARLIENHKLVTSGVYQIVRHPIYTAMLGMLIATGIALSNWLALLIAGVVFFTGTKIRTISEEKLLRDAFPQDYEDYAKRVSGFIPFVKI